MGRSAVLAIVLAACAFHAPASSDGATGDDASSGDDGPPPMIDAPIDPACAELWLYDASNFDPCAQGAVLPALALVPGNYRYTPATGELLLDGTPYMSLPTTGTSPRILSLAGLVIPVGANVFVGGSVPLIIGVHGDASIDGVLDVSANGTGAGPGGDSCAGNPGTNATTIPAWNAGGGGGGGAFGTDGAPGGYGDSEPAQPKVPGGGTMTAVGEPLLVPLRGGCGGGAGGEEDPRCASTGTPGGGGAGGGAIQVSARDTLAVLGSGRIAASGGGGERGVNDTFNGGYHVGVGGGGGGSGGGILLEGANLTIAPGAILCANGGGGGGGTHNNDGTITDGQGGQCAISPAIGGTGERGNGGAGAYDVVGAIPGTGGSRQDDGGGGGGGGGGRIRVRAALGSAPASFASTPPAHVD